MFEFILKQLKQNKKGFTLVELVVVIAILGILAAIAVPKFSQSQVKAAENAHLANVRTLESAANMYLANGGQGGDDYFWEGKTNMEDWSNYIQEWPKTPLKINSVEKGTEYKVEIKADGTIIVTPNGKEAGE